MFRFLRATIKGLNTISERSEGLCLLSFMNDVCINIKMNGKEWISWFKAQCTLYRGADKSLALPGRKQATVTEDFYVHISYL